MPGNVFTASRRKRPRGTDGDAGNRISSLAPGNRVQQFRRTAITWNIRLSQETNNKRALLQNPIIILLDESKRIPRVRRVASLGPAYVRLSDELCPSTDQMHFNRRTNLQLGRTAAQEPVATDIFCCAHFLKWFFTGIDSSQLQRHSQADAQFTSPLGPGGLQHPCQTRAQRFKINGFLEICRRAELFAKRFRRGTRFSTDDDEWNQLRGSHGI